MNTAPARQSLRLSGSCCLDPCQTTPVLSLVTGAVGRSTLGPSHTRSPPCHPASGLLWPRKSRWRVSCPDRVFVPAATTLEPLGVQGIRVLWGHALPQDRSAAYPCPYKCQARLHSGAAESSETHHLLQRQVLASCDWAGPWGTKDQGGHGPSSNDKNLDK